MMMEIQDRNKLCFPHLNNSCLKPTLQQSESLLFNILLFISLITAALNLLVIISVSHFRKLHTPANIILLSLAVSDFLVGCLLMPLEILRNTSCWLLGDIMCCLFYFMLCNIVATSIGNIVFISVDRNTAICDPLRYPTKITLARVRFSVCLCWFCAASFSFLYVKDELTQLGSGRSCIGECKIVINYTTGIVDLVLNFIFPVIVIIVLYMGVFKVVVSQARAMRSHITAVRFNQSASLTNKSELKAARTLGVLVLVFLTCVCPYYIVSLAGNTSPVVYVTYLFYFNSCMNPMIYTLFYPWFRRAIKLIFTLQILKPGSREANIL